MAPIPSLSLRKAVATSAIYLFSLVASVTFTPVTTPTLDLSSLGRVALTGDFDAISIYTYAEQNENSFSTNGSQSLLTQLPNGAFTVVESSDAYIMTMCPFVRSNGDLAGIVVGGNFTSLGGTEAQGIALWDPTTGGITPLPGLNGSVNALYCDQMTDRVFVGGAFQGAASTNAIAWVGMAGWTNLPFQGFNGPVNAITKSPDGNIVFGGSFSGLGNTTAPSPTGDDLEAINLSSAQISAVNSATTNGYNNPAGIVCHNSAQNQAGSTWLTADGQQGSWTAQLNQSFTPVKLRIWNTDYQGRGTSQFIFEALPLQGNMIFNYTDPATGQMAQCNAICPLAQNTTEGYQDFYFVNYVGMSGFTITLHGWYGAGGGLNGIELYQNQILSYAAPGLNEPACSNASFPSNATSTGPWQVTPSGTAYSVYLTANLTGPNVNSGSASVTFLPDIRESGNYTVTMFTPGCLDQNVCAERGIVQVSAQYAPNTPPVITNIYQTNYYRKYDQIYYGYVDASSSSFRPSITLSALPNQNASISIVAQSVQFNLLSGSSSSGLNGLYEYNSNLAVATINSTGGLDALGNQLSSEAEITGLAVVGNTVYAAGSFTYQNTSNVLAVTNGNASVLPGLGLNSGVSSLFQWGNLLFFGGNFTTSGDGLKNLSYIAIYNTNANTWSSMGNGVNGPVNAIVPLELNITANTPETCVTVNGDFDQVNAFGSSAAFGTDGGFAVWVPSLNNWLPNANLSTNSVSGQLVYAINVTDSSTQSQLLAGTLSSQGMGANDAVALTSVNGNPQLIPLGLQIASSENTGLSPERASAQTPNLNGAVTGLFVTDNSRNISIIGGHFEATASDQSSMYNLAYISTNSSGATIVSGTGPGLDQNSTVLTLAYSSSDDTLYVGGYVTGTINNGAVNGVSIWNLTSMSWASNQPTALQGPNVSVSAITPQPSSSAIYIGGAFQSAGSYQCPGLCVLTNGQWSRPGQGLQGNVSALLWQGNNQLLVGGNLSISGTQTYLATYNAAPSSQSWTAIGNGTLPGPVTLLTPADAQASSYWISGLYPNGSAYIATYTSSSSSFSVLPNAFGPSSIVNGISVLTLTTSHSETSLLDSNLALLVTGSLNMPSYGNASAVLYNGTAFSPFILSNLGNGPGSLSQLITQYSPSFSNSNTGYLSVGAIVGISLAIALGLLALLVLAGILLERWRRHREGYVPVRSASPLAPAGEKLGNVNRVPPEELFGGLGHGGNAPPGMI